MCVVSLMVVPGGCNDWSIPYIDQVLMEQACKGRECHLVQFSWLTDLVKPAVGKIMIRQKSDAGSDTWFLVCGVMGNGAVVCWPHEESVEPELDEVHYHPFKEVSDFRSLFHFLWDISKWQGLGEPIESS